MRLQSWRPSVQVHKMHSRTFPKTGCHMSPCEYVLPLYKQAEGKSKTCECCATRGSGCEVARQVEYSPLWCLLCIRIFTVVSEAPPRLSLLRLRPRGELLTLKGVARSNRVLLCSPEHWSTECLFCKQRDINSCPSSIQLLALISLSRLILSDQEVRGSREIRTALSLRIAEK